MDWAIMRCQKRLGPDDPSFHLQKMKRLFPEDAKWPIQRVGPPDPTGKIQTQESV